MLTQKEIDWIVNISKVQGVIHPHQIGDLWEIYFNVNGRYPNGNKTCDNCVRDTFNNVKQAMINQQNEPPATVPVAQTPTIEQPPAIEQKPDKMQEAKKDAEQFINKDKGKDKA